MAYRTKRTRRLVASALAILVVTIGAAAIVGPLEWLRRQSVEQEELVVLTEDLRSRLVDREELVVERLQLEQIHSQRTDLIEAETPVLAGAALQGMLGNLVQASGGVLESTSLDPAVGAGSFTKVALRVELLNDIEGLRELLYAIETHHPTLVIEVINLRRRSGDDFALDLDISMQISAFTMAPLPIAESSIASGQT
ncbi:MAG: type II secretion system protein GspM [Pseudomonadota bacterium]